MAISLSPMEIGRLRMSTGYGRSKNERPLSPIEVGTLINKARHNGASIRDCAEALQLEGTGQIGRFLRILDLPEEFQHLISWGRKKNEIGFSTAVELGVLKNAEDQRIACQSVLSDKLTKSEVRQVAQLRLRSKRPINECIKEVIGMRPVITKHFVFVGTVGLSKTERELTHLTQAERDAILKACITELNITETTGKLGSKFFTLIGGQCFNLWMSNTGQKNIEEQFRSHIKEHLSYV